MANRDVRDALVAFGLASFGIAVLVALGHAVPIVSANLGALVAVVFLYVPVYFAHKRGEDLYSYGFRGPPWKKGLLIGFGVPLLIFPLFAICYAGFFEVACDPATSEWLRTLAPPGSCIRFRGWDQVQAPAFDLELLERAFVQVVVVALPEELFFRGFLHDLLERAIPPKRRIWGGGIGWALVLSSLLFALVHPIATMDPRNLSVFFPALLFGWMRSATGSILAGTIAHASSNLFIYWLEQMYL